MASLPDAALGSPDHLVEVERCVLCRGDARRVRFRQDPFSVVECAGCGMVWVTPRVRDDLLHRVYAEDYWCSRSPKDRGYADYARDEALYRRTFVRRLAWLEGFLRGPGWALDVGCSNGVFLDVLAERGWQVRGVEPSATIAAGARARLGEDRVHVGDLESAGLPEGRFDLISFWDVVEHVPDPVSLLRHATRLLCDDGVLVVETQNVRSLFARVLGPRWQHYKHLEHLYHFGPETLARLLASAGLEPLVTTARHAGKYVPIGFVRERATRVHPLMRTLLAPLAPLDRFALYVNPGDELIAVCRKRREA